jgi:hypothetical protein
LVSVVVLMHARSTRVSGLLFLRIATRVPGVSGEDESMSWWGGGERTCCQVGTDVDNCALKKRFEHSSCIWYVTGERICVMIQGSRQETMCFARRSVRSSWLWVGGI